MLSLASSLLLKRGACHVWRTPFSTAATFEGSTMSVSPFHQWSLQWNQITVSFDRLVTSTFDVLSESIWNMSSTLKKRRHKMNKHKLRKRMKKLRLKSKK
jgi:Mitochondrial domain of unknown function (DUF1713)